MASQAAAIAATPRSRSSTADGDQCSRLLATRGPAANPAVIAIVARRGPDALSLASADSSFTQAAPVPKARPLAAPCAIFGTGRAEITGTDWHEFRPCGPPGTRVDQWLRSGRVLTSAGKSAGTDLYLHVVRRDYSASVANEIARRLVTPPHREGGQAQYITAQARKSDPDSLGDAMAWAMGNITEPITIEDLAAGHT